MADSKLKQEMSDVDFKRVRKSAAYKLKYTQGNKRINPKDMGFHWGNRLGAFPQSGRCWKLTCDIVEDTFDPEDADFGGVCVLRPGNELELYNRKCLDGNIHLFVASGPDGSASWMIYATLAHSHLVQVLKNLAGKAKVPDDVTERLGILVHGDGHVCQETLETNDSLFTTYVKRLNDACTCDSDGYRGA